MKKISFYLCVLLAVLVSCKDSSSSIFMPVSSGRPYEILVVINKALWERPTGRALHDVLNSDVPGLPQPEQAFRVSTCDMEHFDRTYKIFRNIVVVDINPDLYTQTKFKFVRDVNASPQMILSIQSPSEAEFSDYVATHGQVIVDFFVKAELNRAIVTLEKDHEKNVEKEVKKMFNCEIWVPTDLSSIKKGKDFLWASSPTSNNLNFCIYSYPYTDKNTFTPAYFAHKRDSVMKINIPGARKGMYMATFKDYIDSKNTAVRHNFAQVVRGLWEMEGDFMGGPYVSHARVDTTAQRVIVVEGFVYAPNEKKRNLIRKLEASLYTMKFLSDKKEELTVSGVEETEQVDEKIKNKSKNK